MVERAYRQGYVLAPAFAEQLPAYEKQDMAMRLYFREMVEAVDLGREEARAQGLEFEQQAVVRKAERPPAPVIEPTQVEKTLEEAEEMYRKRDLEGARDLFMRALRESDERPAKAKAYYGLARAATLQNDPELAVSLFERALTFSPAPPDKAWILVYLGRLSDMAGDTEKAASYYRNALAIGEMSDGARAMAEKGAAGEFRRGPLRE
jgi:tetratricopeptide (TPR) repeat protein